MPNNVYTVAEKVEMVQQRAQGLSCQRISKYFAASYPDRPIPSKSTVQRIVKQFRDTGNVNSSLKKLSYPSRHLTEEAKWNIFLAAEDPARKPLRRIGQELGISKSVVHRTLKSEKYKAYKIHVHQKLMPGDDEDRLVFSDRMMAYLNADPGLIDRICFSDECTIELVGIPNRQNNRIWSSVNPNAMIQSNTQYQQKLNVWLGMIGNRLIGPFFIDGNLNGEKYLRMLREQIVPALRAIEGNGPVVWFQQDGAPAHFTLAVRAYLDEEFPERWIGRGGPVRWPARSPDLSPLDFSLWSYLRNRLYVESEMENLEMLRNRVVEVLEDIDPRAVSNMNRAFYDRLGYCTAAAGGHFEHILRQPI